MPDIPQLAQSDLLNQLLSLFPVGWTGDSAKNPGGKLWALYTALSGGLADQLGANPTEPGAPTIQFAHDLTRIKTATGVGLDTIAQDFFGDNLPRMTMESDAVYRARILYNIFLPKVTRANIAAALTNALGVTPRMIEPWDTRDCAAWGSHSYWGVDQASAPARWGGPKAYTGFIELPVPSVQLVSFGYKQPGAYFRFAAYAGPALPNLNFESQALQLINAIKAAGTLIGVRFLMIAPAGQVAGVATLLADNLFSEPNDTSTTLLEGFVCAFALAIECPSWVTNAWLAVEGSSFVIGVGSQAPDVASIGFLAIPLSSTKVQRIWLGPDQYTAYVPGVTISSLAFPNWNTVVWANPSGSGTQYSVETPGPGYIDIVAFPAPSGGAAAVAADTYSVVVAVPNVLPYAVMVTPSWPTRVGVTKSNNSFTAAFDTPAPPGGGTLYWGAVEGIA